MKNVLLVSCVIFLFSCKTEELVIDQKRPTEKAFISFRDTGSKRDDRLIELNIPLEFSFQNKTSKNIIVPNSINFSFLMYEKDIQSGYNFPNFFEKKDEKFQMEFIIKPNETKVLKVYYLFGINNLSKTNDCLFNNYYSKLKKQDTIFITDNNDSCIEKYYNFFYKDNSYSTIEYYKEGQDTPRNKKLLNIRFN